MRSSKSRSRSKQNRPRTVGNIINRVFDSSGPEGKVRGTPQQIIEKYQQLARDAQLSNDRVAAENFLQHAEHYTRLLAEAMREMAAEQEARQQSSQQNGQNQQPGGYQRDRNERGDYRSDPSTEATSYAPASEGFEVVGEDSSNLVDLPEAPRQREPRRDEPRREEPRRDDRPRDDRPREPRQNDRPREARRDDKPRDDRPRDDRPRDDRVRDDRPRESRPREDRIVDERPREDRPREDRPREERPREERARDDRRRASEVQADLPSFITGAPAAELAPAPVKAAVKPVVKAAPAPEAITSGDEAPKPVRATRARKPAVAKPETSDIVE